MSDLKIDARLKEINIKIRAMEGEQTRRRLEASNGLNDELHAIDDKFHEEMKALKENYMQERQSIEDRYFANRKAIDKEYEDKRLDLIDSIKEVIGDISEVVGFESNKENAFNAFESVENNYTSIFNNNENVVNDNTINNAPTQTPLTSLDDIEESLESVTSGFSPIEPTIEDVNASDVNSFVVNTEIPEIPDIPEINNVSVEQTISQEPVNQEQIINQNIQMPVQELEEIPIVPVVEQPVTMEVPVMLEPEMIQQQANTIQTQPVMQEVSSVPAEANVVQDINASIDNVLGDINSNAN